MFYCDACAEKLNWPKAWWIPKSRGRCEMCETTTSCYDVPSSQLPDPTPNKEGEGK